MTTTSSTRAIPLTTVFTPPSDCLSRLTLTDSNVILGAGSSCLPSGANGGRREFSPAWICPSGWTSAGGTISTLGLFASETRVTCCPKIDQLSLSGSSNLGLYTQYNPPCVASLTLSGGELVVIDGISDFSTDTERIDGWIIATVQAPSLQIAWQASDTASLTARSTSTLSPSPATTSSAAPAATTTSDSEVESSSASLSTGAKIAIGVVIPVVVLAAIALGFFIIRQRKSKKRSTNREIQQEIPQDEFSDATSTPMTDKYKSPHVGYVPVEQRLRSEYDDQSRSSRTARPSWN